jgi:ribulose-5-phosphate 4-epimerase/fuculose-1-phosphate aldolase
MVKIDSELATKLALGCNILAMEGHSDMILGHVSARLPGQEYLHMKPHNLGLEEVRAEDIIIIDLEGNKLAGERDRHTEYPIHTEICKIRPEVNCVIHTHPPYATALGAAGGGLHPINNEAVLFVNPPLFTETTMLIVTPAQGQAVARCLGQARAVLLQNHGVVVVGQSIEEATIYAVLLEKAARQECLTRQFGQPVWSSEEETRRKVEQIFHPRGIERFWQYFARKVENC